MFKKSTCKPASESKNWGKTRRRSLGTLLVLFTELGSSVSTAKPKLPPQCADAATCVQYLDVGDSAPYPGVLLSTKDAAELVVSASVARSLFDLELRRRDAEHAVRLGAARKLCQAEQDAQVRVHDAYRRDAERLEAWYRSPLLWFVAGFSAASLALLTGHLVFN